MTIAEVKTVAEMPMTMQFVSDSQGVQAIREHFGWPEAHDGFSSFFVLVGDGECLQVWGMSETVPTLTNRVYRILLPF